MVEEEFEEIYPMRGYDPEILISLFARESGLSVERVRDLWNKLGEDKRNQRPEPPAPDESREI